MYTILIFTKKKKRNIEQNRTKLNIYLPVYTHKFSAFLKSNINAEEILRRYLI